MTDSPLPSDELVKRVAQAIGEVIWGGEVLPKGNWLKAARAAIAAINGER